MPRRVTTTITVDDPMSEDEEPQDDVVRRNPRRGAAEKVVTMAEHSDGDDDESMSEESEAEEDPAEESSSEYEDEEEAPPRRRRARGGGTKPLKEVSENRRTSSRSTKFTSSMKEPSDHAFASALPATPPLKQRRVSRLPKSPAACHTSQRRRVKTEVHVDSSESESSSGSESETEEELDEIRIQRIIASRSVSLGEWKKICQNINTSEIDYGSRWDQDDDRNPDDFQERFLVKWADLSFLHCSWETQQDLMDQVEGSKNYLTTFFRKSENGLLFSADERCDGDYFDPAYCQIDRILEIHWPDNVSKKQDDFGIVMDKQNPEYEGGTGRQFLVKWGNQPYKDCSYEFERDLILNDVEYKQQVEDFKRRCKKPTNAELKKAHKSGEEETRRTYKVFGEESNLSDEVREEQVKAYQKDLEEHVFANGGQLRDYQAEGVSWLMANYVNFRSSILADEMGLGKTIQTAVFINMVAEKLKHRGPFLIVAPLSTIPHWHREFSGWTNLNTIVYHGCAGNRERIREFEMAYQVDRPKDGVAFNKSYLRKCVPKSKAMVWMAQVVITTPEMLVTDDFAELTTIHWDVLVVDEAHRLKNHSSKLANNLRDGRFKFDHKLLLTGTPIQNNMTELWTLLNIVDPDAFNRMDTFLTEYGDIKSKEKIDELHERIRPYILRRLKEDVEKSVPPKEETLIEVELTILQKQYYRALYEKNVQFLHRNKRKALDGPSISNLAMQLRKCCNHPFLLNGVEDEVRAQESGADEGDFLVKASGKLVLLDKLLPRLKEGGHRILVFSQFKIMLDILEDYLNARKMKFERIDGSITGNKRQMAIDRFQAEAVEDRDTPFVMLLSTRAGGVGINLTAADTCIIFDSDWNPQNDLQAQARCHRIGQTKSVKVYRLLSRKTYEMQMFHMSSLKMGLDQAVLQGFENAGSASGDGNMTKEEVERLLRHGAYDIFNEEKSGNAEAESNDFIQQDIDSILERRSRKVIHDNTGSQSNAAGGTFSKASFKAAKSPDKKGNHEDVDVDDPEFWKKMVGEAKMEDHSTDLAGKKRRRKEQNYSERDYERRMNATLVHSDSDSEDSSEEEESDSDDWSLSPPTESNLDDENLLDVEGVVTIPPPNAAPRRKKSKKKKPERSKWGGGHWEKADVEKLFKALQMYGYGNMSWDAFSDKIEFPVRSDYTVEQIKHMSWSIALLVLREAADEDVINAKRRAERLAEKKRVADGTVSPLPSPSKGGVLGLSPAEKESGNQDTIRGEAEKQLNASFKKLWSSNVSWASIAVKDALEYADATSPRPKDILAKALNDGHGGKPTETEGLQSLFARNIWPSLKSRGWTCEMHREGKYAGITHYQFGGKEYRSPESVLRAVPSIYPELSNAVDTVISSAASAAVVVERARMLEAKNASLAPDKVTAESLSLFLQMYAPLPLLADRTKSRKIVLARRLLGVCCSLHTANALVRHCAEAPGDSVTDQLAKLLCVQKRLALPHPSWTSRHDAILIQAIAKHGWIDHETCCRAITEDSTIKWGAPFDEMADSNNEGSLPPLSQEEEKDKEKSLLILKDTAQRAAAFFTASYDMIQELKGFNQNLVVNAYGLERVVNEDDDEVDQEGEWVVNNALLQQAAEGASITGEDDEAQSSGLEDLPTKKDLLRRAKAVLSRSVSSLSSQPSTPTASEDTGPPTPSYKYCILDQGDRCNMLLAEMLRGLLKAPFSKNSKSSVLKESRRLCAHAAEESQSRCDDLRKLEPTNPDVPEGPACSPSKDCAHAAGESQSRCDDLRKLEPADLDVPEGPACPPSKEMQKISEHIEEVRFHMKRSSRQAKNVLRVMLGLPPVPGKNESEELFPSEQRLGLTIIDVKSGSGAKTKDGKKKKEKDSNATGDLAITRGMARAAVPDDNGRSKTFDDPSDPKVLQLTATETLLLSVISSQGLPVWTPHWNDLIETSDVNPEHQGLGHLYAISWHGMGVVAETAAELWHDTALSKLKEGRKAYDQKFTDARTRESGEGKKALRKIKACELDERIKRRAASTIRDYCKNPLKLAKKSVMLLEALRLRMGPVEMKGGPSKRSKSENGLGPKVLLWLGKEVGRWAKVLCTTDETGRTLAHTAGDFIKDFPRYREDDAYGIAAVLDKKGCRNVFSQIAQQSRARAVVLKHSPPDMAELIKKALRNSRNAEDKWEKPIWWCDGVGADRDLVTGLLEFGYSGFGDMLASNPALAGHPKDHATNGSPAFTKACAQVRMNQLTRELGALDDTADVLRMVRERCVVVSDGTEASSSKPLAGGGVQTGIQAFFASSESNGKKDHPIVVLSDSEDNVLPNSKDVDVNDSDDASVQVVSSIKPAKRKEDGFDADAETSSAEKKRKTAE